MWLYVYCFGGVTLSLATRSYSQFLPAQQSLVQQYAASTLLQQGKCVCLCVSSGGVGVQYSSSPSQTLARPCSTSALTLITGEALLNGIVSLCGVLARASAFIASTPVPDPCPPTMSLPSDITAAAAVPFFLAPEAAVARVASSRTRFALAQSNAALAASVSRVIRGNPQWNDAVSDASLAMLKQRCAAAVSEILPLLQPLRNAAAEAHEARAQVGPAFLFFHV